MTFDSHNLTGSNKIGVRVLSLLNSKQSHVKFLEGAEDRY